MKSQKKNNDNPLPGRSCSPVKKPHKEKCYGNKDRTWGTDQASWRQTVYESPSISDRFKRGGHCPSHGRAGVGVHAEGVSYFAEESGGGCVFLSGDRFPGIHYHFPFRQRSRQRHRQSDGGWRGGFSGGDAG